MKRMRLAATVGMVAVLAVSAMSPAFATVADGVAPKTVGILIQGPAPGDGGVAVGGRYAVSAYVSAGDVTAGVTDRTVSLTFPAGVTVTALYRAVPGRDMVLIPVTGRTVTDKATAVPATVSAGWLADVVVDEDTQPGTKLVTTATSAGRDIGSVSVATVTAGTALCNPTVTPSMCVSSSTAGGPRMTSQLTTVMARFRWIPADQPPTSPGFLTDVEPHGDGQIHLRANDNVLPGAPTQLGLQAYAQAYATAHKATLKPGWLVVDTTEWIRHYDATTAGVVYAQSDESVNGRYTATIAINGPLKAAPTPDPIRVPTPIIAG